MKRSCITLLLLASISSGCATGVGCATGAGAGLVTGAALLAADDSLHASAAPALLGTAAFGALTGCVAGLFSGMRATAIERQRAERSALQQPQFTVTATGR